MCLLNHQRTHQTFQLLTTWDSVGIPHDPLDPQDPRDPLGLFLDPLGPLTIWDPVGLPLDTLGPCRPTLDPLGRCRPIPWPPTTHFISRTYLGQFGFVLSSILRNYWTKKEIAALIIEVPRKRHITIQAHWTCVGVCVALPLKLRTFVLKIGRRQPRARKSERKLK